MQKLKEMNLKNQKASSKIKEQKLKKNHQAIILSRKYSVKGRGVKS